MKIKVVFRTDKEGTYALFPAEPWSSDPRLCTCYNPLGGHCGANPILCVRSSRPATPAEYAELVEILTRNYEYDLQIGQRCTRHDERQRRREIDRIRAKGNSL